MNWTLRRRYTLPLVLVALASLLFAAGTQPALGQSPGEPLTITFQNIHEGDTIGAKPFAIQFCFSEPINIRDLFAGGDFEFSLRTPENLGTGLRIVFQRDGWGVAVYPGDPPSLPGTTARSDSWTYRWRVVSAEDPNDVNEGELNFVVDESAEPIPLETPPPCLSSGETATPDGNGGDTPTPAGSGQATDEPDDTGGPDNGETEPEESPDNGEVIDDDDDDPDIAALALLTIGAAAGVALLALIGYVVRRGVGYDPHRPTDGDTGDHH